MNDVPDSELLSAYLDGELSVAERARVEQLLATSQDARQLLQELRTLSATLRNLPAYELREDLRAVVLSQGQRQMLAEPPRADENAPSPPLWQTILRRMLTPRSLVSTSLILLVAVMLMLNERQPGPQPAEKEVAMAAREAAEPKSMPAFRAAPAEHVPKQPAFVAKAPAESFAGKGAAADAGAGARTRKSVAGAAVESQLGAARIAPTPSSAAGEPVTKPPSGAAGYAGRATGGGVLLVQCDVTLEAAQRQVLQKVLVNNQITWETPVNAEAKAPARSPDRLYAEATPTQIENALAAIARNRAAFSSIVVQPAPEVPIQQAWTRYNRTGAGPAEAFYSKKAAAKSGPMPADRRMRTTGPQSQQMLANSAEAPGLGEAAQSQQAYVGQDAPEKQRVLFVLRVVDARAAEADSAAPNAAPPSQMKP